LGLLKHTNLAARRVFLFNLVLTEIHRLRRHGSEEGLSLTAAAVIRAAARRGFCAQGLADVA
jgi:hypothetical protein